MSKELMMQKFLLNNGWLKRGATSWVRKEWQEELNKLGKDANLSPKWHLQESIDDAYVMAKVESTRIETIFKGNSIVESFLEKIILDSINGSDWGDVRSAVNGFTKKNLYDWYLNVTNEPNPEILEFFNKKK